MCGLPLLCHTKPPEPKFVKSQHRVRTRQLTRRPAQKRSAEPRLYLGIDGEGQGRGDHRYVFLACSDETGLRKWSVEDRTGIRTEAFLDFILKLPPAKVFAYAFGYDLTKGLVDLDNQALYMLFRPDLRQRTGPDASLGPYFVQWRHYELNLQGSKFTVQAYGKKVVIWDIFKFFQSKFVGAIKDWKVGNEKLWTRMQAMKDQRSEFDRLAKEEVEAYCFEECACMAELARRLTEAHVTVGLKLTAYYGAGSSASAMLKKMGIKDYLSKSYPKEMEMAIASAFFGGRFENSVIGPVREKVYSKDISSAYPYQLFFLPCLLHGSWELTKDRKELDNSGVKGAIVRYELGTPPPSRNYKAWGPFPFRTSDGAICFPDRSGGGWVYLAEYIAAERIYPNIRFIEAWVLHTECDCCPFAKIPGYYAERCRIGKEGPGIVIKLGCNSCYGKLAQSIGNATFNSWVWAGMITSGCRAQGLEVLGLHEDWSNLLMFATDGIASLEDVASPVPKDTGTFKVLSKGKLTPLGGWEDKTLEKGMFFARPGIYFPMNPTKDEVKEVRGRGVGKGVVLENWQRIVEAWPVRNVKRDIVAVSNVSRFCGAKSCISRSGLPGNYIYKRANGTEEVDGALPSYGQWITRKVEMSFDPMPKRLRVRSDNRRLELRHIPGNVASAPYNKAVSGDEALQLRVVEEEASEQPDGDLCDYE